MFKDIGINKNFTNPFYDKKKKQKHRNILCTCISTFSEIMCILLIFFHNLLFFILKSILFYGRYIRIWPLHFFYQLQYLGFVYNM